MRTFAAAACLTAATVPATAMAAPEPIRPSAACQQAIEQLPGFRAVAGVAGIRDNGQETRIGAGMFRQMIDTQAEEHGVAPAQFERRRAGRHTVDIGTIMVENRPYRWGLVRLNDTHPCGMYRLQ